MSAAAAWVAQIPHASADAPLSSSTRSAPSTSSPSVRSVPSSAVSSRRDRSATPIGVSGSASNAAGASDCAVGSATSRRACAAGERGGKESERASAAGSGESAPREPPASGNASVTASPPRSATPLGDFSANAPLGVEPTSKRLALPFASARASPGESDARSPFRHRRFPRGETSESEPHPGCETRWWGASRARGDGDRNGDDEEPTAAPAALRCRCSRARGVRSPSGASWRVEGSA